ncbi:MAG: ferrous iron transporter B [Puniceicoccaceae bacterium]|nr:MAG: ferrous iron transporter B [Puniceicoccaceae bacterium]
MTVMEKRIQGADPEAAKFSVFVLGLESVGKTSLLAALTGRVARSEGYAGSTLYCETYQDRGINWIDAPGWVRDSDAATTAESLERMIEVEQLLLVLRADRAVEELRLLAPLAAGKRVSIVLTFADRLTLHAARRRQLLKEWSTQLGVPVALVNARAPEAEMLAAVREGVAGAGELVSTPDYAALPELGAVAASSQAGWLSLPPVALALLLAPAVVAVLQANALADRLYEPLLSAIGPLLDRLNQWPEPLPSILAGDYGIVAMLPFLILYALPTILVFTGLIAVYKNTGLIDRLSYGLHRWLRPFGLGGRDLVRVIMGFGCNVPAVISTRSCGSCSRGACVSAISFGSACSYQLPATLAVFAAAGMVWLAPVYLLVLGVTTLIYLRLTTPKVLRDAQNRLLMPPREPLHRPQWRAIGRELGSGVTDFFRIAFPIFLGICVLAGLLQWLGVIDAFAHACAPLMAAFRLPPEAAIAVVLGSIRKDGIAIGLLDSDWAALKLPMDSAVQVLTVVYLAGVLLPCLVTLLTVAREMRWKFALRMLGRQVAFAAGFALCIAWVGALL